MTATFARFPLRGISGEERCKRHTVKECSPRNVKRRGAGCRFRSDSLYEQINENPASEEHAEREKKKEKRGEKKEDRARIERKKGTIRLRCFNSLSSDNDLRQPDPRFLHFFHSRRTPARLCNLVAKRATAKSLIVRVPEGSRRSNFYPLFRLVYPIVIALPVFG